MQTCPCKMHTWNIFLLIGMKFHGTFLEANNLCFGKEPQHRGKKISGGVSLETGAEFFCFFVVVCQ